MKKKIHINCDLGEGGEHDADLMPLISACNIACGGHAGNLDTMHRTVQLAMENKIEIGAHPSYPDKTNFGRKSMKMSDEDLKLSIEAQVLTLKQIIEAEGGKLSHIKLHGALYNDAAKDENIARTVIDALDLLEENYRLFVPFNSKISEYAMGKYELFCEVFGDRNYEHDLSLVSRSKPNAVIDQKEQVFEHVFSMFRDKKITTISGEKINCKADTFCIHSDTNSAVEILEYLHKKFAEEGISIINS
ncbi:lactam utilization protein LamB [Christiangramia fulva]|uniref:Lactam utilization protein LamB n=1 Tax=Christiangramia fulva TaxID=2126553 RepID=A0A2R3ZB99_9FLAO|nr:5-oxoprolinase subunit PxpA [Christiangramia fulva]AVR47545.1 lactam utilization protein LamB [Christiangramia fulva]